MTGMTPAWLTFNGRYVDVPPYCRRPTMRLAYWTGIRRCACSTNTTATMMASPRARISVKTKPPAVCRMVLPSLGMRAAIDVNISTLMPLPTPRSVTSSPNHMMIAVPAVMMMTIVASAGTPSL